MATVKTQRSLSGLLGAAWAIAGFSLILLDAINRLARISWQALGAELSVTQWALLVFVVVLMAYSEGYRGFQKSFSPRSAARIYYLYRHPEPIAVLFAPLFCMGFFRATRRPLLVAWVGTCIIVSLVVALHSAPQPWRGMVDAGVVVGLSWGLLSFLLATGRAFATGTYPVSPEVPEQVAVPA
jgi:hypothetical protein